MIRLTRLLVLFAVFTVFTVFCGAPPSGRAAGDDPVEMIERQIGLLKDGRTTRYVRAVGARAGDG